MSLLAKKKTKNIYIYVITDTQVSRQQLGMPNKINIVVEVVRVRTTNFKELNLKTHNFSFVFVVVVV